MFGWNESTDVDSSRLKDAEDDGEEEQDDDEVISMVGVDSKKEPPAKVLPSLSPFSLRTSS